MAAGDTVDVGTVLARTATNGARSTISPPETDGASTGHVRKSAAPHPNRARYSPVVQRITARHSVDLSLVSGLGGVTTPLSRMRQSIGAAMLRSQRTTAACHTVVECDMTQIERRRHKLGLTARPLIARATIDTLRESPS